MILADPDWRVVAFYRGVGGVSNRGELRQCLIEQMAPRERRRYRRQRLAHILLVVGMFAVFWWIGHWILGVWFAWFVSLAGSYRLDPVHKAGLEFNRELAAELHEINRQVREAREAQEVW